MDIFDKCLKFEQLLQFVRSQNRFFYSRAVLPAAAPVTVREGHEPAEVSFRFALAVEEIHHQMYQEALAAIESGKDLPERRVYVCPVCGNTVYDAAPEKCPICQAPGSSFTAVS